MVVDPRTEISCDRKHKKTKIQEFVYRNTTNVGHEVSDNTGNNSSHQHSNKRLKEKFGNSTRKTVNRITTKMAILGMSHIIWKILQSET